MYESGAPLILASTSPQRQRILADLEIPFTAVPANITETFPAGLDAADVPEYLARKKAQTVAERLDAEGGRGTAVLGADTMVLLGNRPYGKPADEKEARRFLLDLSGKTHRVVTGIALWNPVKGKLVSKSAETYVTFADLTFEDIESYLAEEEWIGAAGAYRIQGKAVRFISHIDGLESTVAGLSIYPLIELLKEHRLITPKSFSF